MGKVIGYTEIREPEAGSITTQAFIVCAGCSRAISSVGGPRYNSYCLTCIRDRYDLFPSPNRKKRSGSDLPVLAPATTDLCTIIRQFDIMSLLDQEKEIVVILPGLMFGLLMSLFLIVVL